MTNSKKVGAFIFEEVQQGNEEVYVAPVTLKSGEETCLIVKDTGIEVPMLHDGTIASKEEYLEGHAPHSFEVICEDTHSEEYVFTSEGYESFEDKVLNNLVEAFFPFQQDAPKIVTNPLIPKERMMKELTQFHNPPLSHEEAEKLVERISEDQSFWMDIEKLFYNQIDALRKD